MRLRTRESAATTLLAIGVLLGGSAAWAQPAVVEQAPPQIQVSPGLSLGIASVSNLRDIGGYTTRDGQVVRKGLLYRSNQLGRISAGDMQKIELLGLKCDYDLRREDERTSAPDKLPADVRNIWLNVMAGSQNPPLPQFGWLTQNPKEANESWGDGKMAARFVAVYHDFVSLPSAQQAYRQMFTDLQDSKNLPALFHCTSGKDRTGWAAAALLTLLAVPREVVFEDYMRSNDYMLTGYKRSIDTFVSAGGDADILPAMLGVKPEYLRAAFEEVQTKYGTIEGYFTQGLKIDSAAQQKLRERFLTRVQSESASSEPAN